MEKNIKNISGVSLVEVIISMFIIAMLLIAIMGLFPRMMQHRKGIHEADQAKIVATEILEGLQALSAHDSYTCGTGAFNSVMGTYNAIMDDRTIGAVTYSAADPVWTCGGDVNTIEVTVKWTKNGKPHNVTVTGAIR